ncbi:hypothetical protein PanWU01x14_311350 [Parasponia andersonii]|uniref:Uncharacterized protein n=1 Tax=Parasponia andersonii TaxID=3476 RepID=A0A2P5AQ21_PARAD|nr:hypothetical protein PanWU01x14_311350 [Parasponia andersonii]
MALVHDGRDREIEKETEWFWHLPDLGVTLEMGPEEEATEESRATTKDAEVAPRFRAERKNLKHFRV